MIAELYTSIKEGTAHTSTLILGDTDALSAEALTLGAHGKGLTLYPMVHDVWTIDDSRAVARRAQRSTDTPLCIMIAANVFTLEAQNALLKVIEDGAPHTFFIIITRSAEALIPTVRSRCALMKEEGKVEQEKEFFALTLPERLNAVARAIDTPEHRSAYALLARLARTYARRTKRGEGTARQYTHLTQIQTLLSKHPIGMRQLLEHLSLTLDK